MDTPQNFEDFFRSWRELTLQERAAIQASSWSVVAEIQQVKKELQRGFSIDEPILKSPLLADPSRRWMGEELNRLEKENASLLRELEQSARNRVTQLRHAARNLRHVHKAYRFAENSIWTSYS